MAISAYGPNRKSVVMLATRQADSAHSCTVPPGMVAPLRVLVWASCQSVTLGSPKTVSRRLVLFRKFLEHLGIHPNRFRMGWVSASEGGKFSDVIKEVTEGVKALGPMESLKREQVWLQSV